MVHLLYEFNVMKSTMLKLCSTTRKSKELASNFHPILMPLKFCKLGVGNIMIPYLKENSFKVRLNKIKGSLINEHGLESETSIPYPCS